MKAKVKSLAMFIVAVLVTVFAVGYAFAWFFDKKNANFTLTGASAGAYFESGDGSKETPFIISNATHMRNLAVLQNTGRFGETQYYFEIKKSLTDPIDMGSIWLPPIGSDDNPFKGNFNGNGKTIKNLKVTTDKALLDETNYPTQASPDYEFSRAVGLFGNTHSDSYIRNFILDNPHVVVGAENQHNNKYSSAAGINKAVGIAVGHVEGMCQSIGVRANDKGASTGDGTGSTSLDVRVDGYSTFNSILGELGAEVASSVTGSAGAMGNGGSGSAFGSNFDVNAFLSRLLAIKRNKDSSTPSWKLPYLSYKNDYPAPIAGEKIPFSVTNSTDETSADYGYAGADAVEEVSPNNVGYFTGDNNKIQPKSLRFASKLVKDGSGNWAFPDGKVPSDVNNFPNWFYSLGTRNAEGKLEYSNNSYSSAYNGFSALTTDEFNELPDSIKQILAVDANNNPHDYTSTASKNQVTKSYDTVRFQTQYWGDATAHLSGSVSQTDGNVAWAYHGQISWMGNTYGEGFRDANGNAVNADGQYLDRNGNVISYQGAPYNEMLKGVPLPNNAIWFKPSQPGKIRLVLYSETAGDAFGFLRCTRIKSSASDPFALDWAANVDTNGGWNTAYANVNCIFTHYLPARVLFYYEYEITEKDLVNGTYPEFFLCKGNTSGNGAYFIYLDLGASASEEVPDVSTVQENKVSAVDFIYDGVEIEQSATSVLGVGNFIVDGALYNASKTIVFFKEVQTVITMAYVRLNPSNPDEAESKTIKLKDGVTLDDDINNMRATYPGHVLPGGIKQQNVDGTSGGSGSSTKTPSISGSTVVVLNGTLLLRAFNFNGTVTWSSNNPAVATVDQDGYVTPVSIGNATITATDGTTTLTKAIRVIAEEIVLEGVNLSANTLTLTVGSSQTLTATAEPAGATYETISWSSTDTSVASVDQNGKVTAVAEGNATIEVTVTNDDGDTFTASCAVTVGATASIPTYSELRNSTDKILNNEFSTDGTVGAHGAFGSTAGVFVSEEGAASISGGVLQQTSGLNKNTEIVLDFGPLASTNSAVEGYFEAQVSAIGSKWNWIKFVDGSGAVKFVIGTGTTNNKLAYVVGDSLTPGGANASGLVDMEIDFAANTLYKVYYKFDLSTGNAIIDINGNTFTVANTGITSLSGVTLASSSSGARVITLDNVVFCGKAEGGTGGDDPAPSVTVFDASAITSTTNVSANAQLGNGFFSTGDGVTAGAGKLTLDSTVGVSSGKVRRAIGIKLEAGTYNVKVTFNGNGNRNIIVGSQNTDNSWKELVKSDSVAKGEGLEVTVSVTLTAETTIYIGSNNSIDVLKIEITKNS